MPLPHPALRIGELARLAGLSPDTLRHYERLGLLTATRTPGRFREYRPEALHRVRVIQAALRIGFGLGELARVFAERAAGRPPCQRVRAMAGEKLDALTRHIEELRRLRAQLARTLASWDARLAVAPAHAPAYLLDSLLEEPRPAVAARSPRLPRRAARRRAPERAPGRPLR
jgi:DNA-binding transcriptional MerR regulator